MIEGLEKLLNDGKDSPELRFGLGNAYLNAGQTQKAAEHLQACIDQRPDYTAAWKLLGKAFLQQQLSERAQKVWQRGIDVARTKGDKQAEKEMQVFLRRLEKQQRSEDG